MCDTQTFIHKLQRQKNAQLRDWVIKTRLLFFSFLLRHTHTHSHSRRKWNTCFWLCQWHHPPCGQSPVPLSGLQLTHCHTQSYRNHQHALGKRTTKPVWDEDGEEEKERVREEGLPAWLRMALLWQLGSCGPHRLIAASKLSLLLLPPLAFTRFLSCFHSPHVSWSLSPSLFFFLTKISHRFPVTSLWPLLIISSFCHFPVHPHSLSPSFFLSSGREGWAPRLLTGSSSRVWRRKEVGVPFSLLICHIQVIIMPVVLIKKQQLDTFISAYRDSLCFMEAMKVL